MTDEENLDLVLKQAQEIKTVFADNDIRHRIINHLNIEFSLSEMNHLLLFLAQENALHKFNDGTFKIAFKGDQILNAGGYVQARKDKELKEKKEKEMHENSVEGLSVSKKSLSWSKYATVAGIISAIIGLASLIYQFTH